MNKGKVSENILTRSVLKNITKNKSIIAGAAVGTDCAIFDDYCTAVGYVADEGIACGAHAIKRAANNMAAGGGISISVMLTISLPAKMREIKLKSIIKLADEAATTLGIAIVGGHTEVVEGLEYPIAVATVTGKKRDNAPRGTAEPGQSIVMTKWMALGGIGRLGEMYGEQLKSKLPTFIIEETKKYEEFYSITEEAKVAWERGCTCMTDVADGGLFAALWKLAARDGVGLEVNLKSVPILQETIEVAEFFDINPYKLRGNGAALIVTSDAEGLIEELALQNILGTEIGKIIEGKDRYVITGEERRFLEEPRQDESCNICYN